jgi:hypothetical protein
LLAKQKATERREIMSSEVAEAKLDRAHARSKNKLAPPQIIIRLGVKVPRTVKLVTAY